MSFFAWLRPQAPQLALSQRERLAALPLPTALGTCTLREQRWVVLDLETSGLNTNRDQVLSIGAVAIEDGAVDFSQQFERTLYRPEQKTNPSVLIHGLGPSALAAGCDPGHALLDLLEFIGTSPVQLSMRRSMSACWHGPSDRAWVIVCKYLSSMWPSWHPCSIPTRCCEKPVSMTG